MDNTLWISFYLIDLVFSLWVLFGSGADWLAESWLGAFLVNFLALTWDRDQVRIYVGAQLLLSTLWFIASIFVPELRNRI